MTKRWIASIALSLGLLAPTAQAGDGPWRMPAKPAANVPAATLGTPIAVESAIPPALPPLVDTQFKATGFIDTPTGTTDPNIPRPLPVGTPSSGGTQHTWINDTPPVGPGHTSNALGKPIAMSASAPAAPAKPVAAIPPLVWQPSTAWRDEPRGRSMIVRDQALDTQSVSPYPPPPLPPGGIVPTSATTGESVAVPTRGREDLPTNN